MKLLAFAVLFAACAASADHQVVQVAPPAPAVAVAETCENDPELQSWLAVGTRSFATRGEAYAFTWKLTQAGLRTDVQHDPTRRCWVCRFA
ncbi:MAG: hypothetical protein U1F60_15000 [Planctomycetota bacterium]